MELVTGRFPGLMAGEKAAKPTFLAQDYFTALKSRIVDELESGTADRALVKFADFARGTGVNVKTHKAGEHRQPA